MSYSHYDVAHRFATGIGERCNGGNVFFEGNTIYSYGHHFPMAIKFNGKLLYNDDTYSVSTSKHQGIVRGACRQYEFIHCATLNDFWPSNPKYFIERNLKCWSGQVKSILEGPMAKARKPEKYLAEILSIVGKVERFCKFFKVRMPSEFKVYSDTMDRERVLEVARETAKKEAERKKREELKAAEKFMNFERDYFSGEYQIVRLRTDKNRFETSMGVQIPFEIGREFYEKLKADELKVGDQVVWYRVLKVGSEIKVGCHTFKRAWLLNYGKKVFANA